MAVLPQLPTSMFKTLRIGILLFILVNVAMGAWLTRQRTTSWQQPLRVVVYPINADGSQASSDYIGSLSHAHWQPMEQFFSDEAQRYRLAQTLPVEVRLGPQVHDLPPESPSGGNMAEIAWWSLKLRYWAWRNDAYRGARPDVRLFALYHDPQAATQMSHSLGLEQGLIGVVHLFADRFMAGSNQVVLAHELLHTVGAHDKYHPHNNLPRFPDGYADPESDPLYPQEFAEIMAGRIALGQTEAAMPRGLGECLIGPATAREIKWLGSND